MNELKATSSVLRFMRVPILSVPVLPSSHQTVSTSPQMHRFLINLDPSQYLSWHFISAPNASGQAAASL